MPMILFFSKFPELAMQETRTVQVKNHSALPDGNYGFLESYCDEDGCDCRRVTLSVRREDDPDTCLATISHGWASIDFYRKWAHCTRKEAEQYKGSSLDPMNPQSEYSRTLLALFRKVLLQDRDYVARLERHYHMMKRKLWDCEAIIGEFRRLSDEFARGAVQMAVIRQQEITPHLLAVIDEAERDPQAAIQSQGRALLYALHLLAQFRERKAYPLIIRFLCTGGDHADYLLGDTTTEGLNQILASVYDGDIAPLQVLVSCPTANEWVRASAVKAHTVLVLWGLMDRSVMIDYLRYMFNNGFETLPDPVRSALVRAAWDIHPGELMDDLRKVLNMGLVDPFCLSRNSIEECAAEPVESILEDSRRDAHLSLISDTVEEMEWWACFNSGSNHARRLSSSFGDYQEEPVTFTPPPKPVRGYIAGNDYCPCGSGKKYKKCCGLAASP
jgi:hypothetical protein